MPDDKDFPPIRIHFSDIPFPEGGQSKNGTASSFGSNIPSQVESSVRSTASTPQVMATNPTSNAKPSNQGPTVFDSTTPTKTPQEPSTIGLDTPAPVRPYTRPAAEILQDMATGTPPSAKTDSNDTTQVQYPTLYTPKTWLDQGRDPPRDAKAPSPRPVEVHPQNSAKRPLDQARGSPPFAKRQSPRSSLDLPHAPVEKPSAQATNLPHPPIGRPPSPGPRQDLSYVPEETQVDQQELYHYHRVPPSAEPPTSPRSDLSRLPVPAKPRVTKASALQSPPTVNPSSSRPLVGNSFTSGALLRKKEKEALASAQPLIPKAPGAQRPEYTAPRQNEPIIWTGITRQLKYDRDSELPTEIRLPFDYTCNNCMKPTRAGTGLAAVRWKAVSLSTTGLELPCSLYTTKCYHCRHPLDFKTDPFKLAYIVEKGHIPDLLRLPRPGIYRTARDVLAHEAELRLYGQHSRPLGDFDGIHGIELSLYLRNLEKEGR